MKLKYELVIIGGGPAGMAAALEAGRNGVENMLILERDKYLGGILPQCIHNGFGLEYFREELTGPEYAYKFIRKILHRDIDVKKRTMVVKISPDKNILALNKEDGLLHIEAKAIILAMGCRERTRANIKIPGDRVAGIFTAGTAQRYMNIEGYMPGSRVVIIGSGDIGLIMARRMKLEGAEVKAVLEILPYSNGLIRNKAQCLDDFNIPLKLQHTITRIEGKDRVERIRVSRVDKNLNIIQGTEEEIRCDTLLFSVGLIPENELSKEMGIKLNNVTGGAIVNEERETSIEGVFAAGNVLHVHDLVDRVTKEAEIAGRAASKYLNGRRKKKCSSLRLLAGENVNYLIPDKIDYNEESRKKIKLFMRAERPMQNVEVKFISGEKTLLSYSRDIVTPGEMITANLPEAIISNNMHNLNISILKKEDENGIQN